ncbi:hemagglutinin repeat-containing protein [Rhizobium metallidurans]|uniref:hemagglutinin repeat-containing protein n=1 Tax=Rhizobium metallidurans TaxID=1265931 RepID=UPI003CCD6300
MPCDHRAGCQRQLRAGTHGSCRLPDLQCYRRPQDRRPEQIQGATDWAGIKKSGLGSASLIVGFNASKTERSASTGIPVVTSIEAGRSVAVAAQSGDITGRGVQMAAGSPEFAQGGDVLLSAGGNIDLRSAGAP